MQAEAYEHDGHCAVLAGPGSGKTRLLVAKVSRLIAHRAVGPRGVACITFNNDAVREMHNRLGQLGLKPSGRLFVGTVHSFCMTFVVRPFAHIFRDDVPSTVAVANQRQRERAFQEALTDTDLGGTPATWKTPFELYRRQHPVRDASSWRDDPRLANLIETYEDTLHRDGLLDFDDMVLVALDLIRRHPFVRSALEARFPFLVVDEYQDLGYPLHLIVRQLMADTSIEVLAVGDPDQSIYSFAGADPAYLRELADESGVHRVDLDMNYRSAQLLIDGSELVLARDEPKSHVSARHGAIGELFFLECPDGLEQQAQVITTQILPALEQEGVPVGQIAILYIDKWDQEILADALGDAGIQYAGIRDPRYPKTRFTQWLEDVRHGVRHSVIFERKLILSISSIGSQTSRKIAAFRSIEEISPPVLSCSTHWHLLRPRICDWSSGSIAWTRSWNCQAASLIPGPVPMI